jgi:hypothetical protein
MAKCPTTNELHPITPDQASNSLANRISTSLDRARQAKVDIGLRPYRILLTWTYSTGDERGQGLEEIYYREELLPTPRIEGLGGVAINPYSAGALPVGSIRVSKISARYDHDFLTGRVLPQPFIQTFKEPIRPPQVDFFYEVHEDGRTSPPQLGICKVPAVVTVPFISIRQKYRLSMQPERKSFGWILGLERMSEDMDRFGESQISTDDIQPTPVIPPLRKKR